MEATSRVLVAGATGALDAAAIAAAVDAAALTRWSMRWDRRGAGS